MLGSKKTRNSHKQNPTTPAVAMLGSKKRDRGQNDEVIRDDRENSSETQKPKRVKLLEVTAPIPPTSARVFNPPTRPDIPEAEIWCEILAIPFYFVSSLGRVSHISGILVSQAVSKYGRRTVSLRLCGALTEKHKKQYGTRQVHLLVAEAFVPNPMGWTRAVHIDGNKFNNRASNLVWRACYSPPSQPQKSKRSAQEMLALVQRTPAAHSAASDSDASSPEVLTASVMASDTTPPAIRTIEPFEPPLPQTPHMVRATVSLGSNTKDVPPEVMSETSSDPFAWCEREIGKPRRDPFALSNQGFDGGNVAHDDPFAWYSLGLAEENVYDVPFAWHCLRFATCNEEGAAPYSA